MLQKIFIAVLTFFIATPTLAHVELILDNISGNIPVRAHIRDKDNQTLAVSLTKPSEMSMAYDEDMVFGNEYLIETFRADTRLICGPHPMRKDKTHLKVTIRMTPTGTCQYAASSWDGRSAVRNKGAIIPPVK